MRKLFIAAIALCTPLICNPAFSTLEQVFTCPKGGGYVQEGWSYKNMEVYTLTLPQFRTAAVSNTPNVIFCYYGYVQMQLPIPKEYSSRTCTFVKGKYVRSCGSKRAEDCKLYCERLR